MTLNKARILSSENDASVRTHQNQTTNVNIKLDTPNSSTNNLKEQVPSNGDITNNMGMGCQYPSVAPTPSPLGIPQYGEVYNPHEVTTRDIELTETIEGKDKQIEFLELLLEAHECNPLIINKILICKSKTLMNMIKILTNADKVDLLLDEDKVCDRCCGKGKLTFITKILIYKDGKTEDFKYKYNDEYSKMLVHGISLKIVV